MTGVTPAFMISKAKRMTLTCRECGSYQDSKWNNGHSCSKCGLPFWEEGQMNRTRLGKLNQAGLISLCPVCLCGVDATRDSKAVWIEENWFHGTCSRFSVLLDRAANALQEYYSTGSTGSEPLAEEIDRLMEGKS